MELCGRLQAISSLETGTQTVCSADWIRRYDVESLRDSSLESPGDPSEGVSSRESLLVKGAQARPPCVLLRQCPMEGMFEEAVCSEEDSRAPMLFCNNNTE